MQDLSICVGENRPDFIKNETLATIFKATATNHPEKIALIFHDKEISYKTLDEWSDAFAFELQSKGLKKGDSCLVWIERGLELHVSILAIVKCGACYVPLDYDMPEERVLSVMEDIEAKFIITSHEFNHPYTVINSVLFDKENTAKYNVPDLSPDDNAYVLFTSGSTGKPKGIVITQRNICNLVRSENELLQITSNDKVYQGFSVSFDMWCEETWVSYLVGATLWVADTVTSKSIDELSTIILENEITVLHAVPSLLAVMETLDLPKLRIINAGGEACTQQVLNKWANGNRTFYNSYGPTETTVSTTFAKLNKGDVITIGKPLANYGLCVVDENMHPLPIGQQGELIVSGVGVSNGYLHLDTLTKEKFLPKNESLNTLPGAMIYRTGDATYMDENQNIHFVGRIDNQVKLRGFRIELGEIESLLNEQEGILQAAVALKKDSNDQDQLTGYVVVNKNTVFDEAASKENLALKLPSYMIPFAIMKLEELPRLPSGKIDRKKLPIPDSYASVPTATENIIIEGDSVAVKIQKILKTVFVKDHIDLQQDFFTDLGGHSLLAASFVSKMREEGNIKNASLKDIYQLRPLSKLAEKWALGEKSIPKSTKVFHSIPAMRYFLCALAQTISLALIFGLLATEIFIPYLAYYFTQANTDSLIKASLAAFLMFCIIPPIYISIGVMVKWIVIGKYKEGKYPLWGSYYFRWWFVNTFQKIVPTQFMNGTPLYPVYLKYMGVKIAPDAQVSSISIGAEDLVSIGEDVSISSNVVLDNVTVENGQLIISKIHIGNHGYLGSSSIMGANTKIEDWGELQDLSFLEDEKEIFYGQVWKGSPAKHFETRTEADFIQPIVVSSKKRFWYKIVYSILLGFFPIFILIPLIPTIITITNLDNEAGYFQFYYIWVTPFLTVFYLILFAFINIILSRILQRNIKPGTYSVYSWFYVKKWLVEQMNSLSLIVLHPMYATIFISKYFRALGAKVGTNTEISTASNVTHALLEIGKNSFIADAVSLGESDIRGQQLILEKTTIGNNSFVGNSALISQGYELADNMLIGVLSIPPTKEQLAQDNAKDWFGSPAIAIPRRQVSQSFDVTKTFYPSKKLIYSRAVVEFIRIILPQTIVLICSIYFIAYSSELLYDQPLWKIILKLPFYYLFFLGIPAFLFTVLLKWVVIGKYKEGNAPMWSMRVWSSELVTSTYEALCIPFLLEYLKGTPWLPLLLKLFGVKTGKRVFLNTADITEFDMVSIGDDTALNEDSGAQTHLFEDRVMKIGPVHFGDRVCIGSRSIILYNTTIEDDVSISSLSLIMKGETIQKNTDWVGSPISEKI